MSAQLQYSMFQDVFFPEAGSSGESSDSGLMLQRVLFYKPHTATLLMESPLVIFDFETTGLDANSDRIIEIGGIKTIGGRIVEEFHTLVKPDIPLSPQAERITGINMVMLEGQPELQDVIGDFLRFIDGAILVAHNAEFDWAFLRNGAGRLGYQLSWPCFCTLKMARALLPELESKNLDSLAKHYGLEFEARHRSIGDCKVTQGVLMHLLAAAQKLKTWQDIAPYAAGQG